jgi:hypothetical protein
MKMAEIDISDNCELCSVSEKLTHNCHDDSYICGLDWMDYPNETPGEECPGLGIWLLVNKDKLNIEVINQWMKENKIRSKTFANNLLKFIKFACQHNKK